MILTLSVSIIQTVCLEACDDRRRELASSLSPVLPARRGRIVSVTKTGGVVQSTWLTRPQLAEELGISTRTLANWASTGQGPEFVKLSPGRSGRVRYHRSVIDTWLVSTRRTAA
ncbi:helix-turn-helix transcriptional regulator [Streptomyces fagopyri]